MAQTLLPFLLLLSSFQADAKVHFPQLVVRGGLSDAIATPTPTLRPNLRVRQFNNGTVSSSSVDPEESPDPTPDTTTVIPVFVPPTTTISGAAETTAAKQIGPVIWGLWNKRKLLEDDNTKQQYIDLVDQTKNDITNLFNNLDNQPEPPSQCCATSLKKRSLISGITNVLKTAADIVSCASCVVNNLDNIVKSVPPDIDIVDTLTDTLSDLKTQLDNLDDNNDDNSQSQSQSESQSSSCTTSTVTDCTIDVYESTTFFVTDGSTTSAVSTSTSSNCQTVTGCSATPTTDYTTIATSTTSSTSDDDICAPSTCNGAACAAKRAMQTHAPLPPTYPFPEVNQETFFPYLNSSLDERHLFGKRDVPGPGSGDWSDFYTGLKGQSDTTTMDINDGVMGTQTSVEFVSFNTAAQNIVIEGLYGCTSVIIVDHRGAFVNHIWEDSALNDVPAGTWQSDGLDLLSNYLDTYAGNTFTPNAKVFLMVSSTKPVDNTGGVDQEVFPPAIIEGGYPSPSELDALSNQAPPAKYADKTDELVQLIKQKLPGIAEPTLWIYRRQKVKAIREKGAGFGRAAVLYDPAQSVDPNGGASQPANTGAWQVYIQADPVDEELWPNLELQIWRVNVAEGSQQESANVLHIGTVGTVVDPCNGDIDPPVPDSMSLNPGNPIIDIGLHATNDDGSSPQKFDIQDANGNNWRTGCVFKGNGVYAATADAGLGAGDLTCDDGYTVQCLRPFNNQATTCNNQPLSDCDQGQLGKNCFPYNQLLATCRV